MNTINKVVHIGTVDLGSPKGASLFCKITYKDGRLSISGVEGPLSSGNCRGSCGQIDMHPWNIKKYAKGWTPSLVKELRKVWATWHLNDMKAGSPAQEAFLAANPVSSTYPESHYDKACEALKAAGLLEDASYIHEGKPYKYGTAWLRAGVPGEVLTFLESLPEADKQPAWI